MAGRRSVGVNSASHLPANDPFQGYASFEKTLSSTHGTEFRPDFNGMIQWHATAGMIIGFNGREKHFVNGTAGTALFTWIDRHRWLLIAHQVTVIVDSHATGWETICTIGTTLEIKRHHGSFIEFLPIKGNREFRFLPAMRTATSCLRNAETLYSHPNAIEFRNRRFAISCQRRSLLSKDRSEFFRARHDLP